MTIALPPAEMIAGARSSEGVSVPGMEATRLIWVHVNGSRRLELRDFPPARREWLKSIGCFTEVIQHKTRMFIPADRTLTIVDQLVRTGRQWNVLTAPASRAA
jgi:hypothetical protein